MRFLSLFAVLCVAISANAAPQTTQAPVGQPSAPQQSATRGGDRFSNVQQTLRGLSLFAYYSMADEFSGQGSGGNVEFTDTAKSAGAFGMGAEYQLLQMPNGVGASFGGSYEFSRTLSKSIIKYKDQPRQEETPDSPKPEVTTAVFYGNGTFQLSEMLSAFGGGNFNFPTIKNVSGYTGKGKIGWQIGGSLNFGSNFAVDGMYRVLNSSGSNDAKTWDNISLAGFLARARYAF